jgi:Flp pilus assembly pilin Flp
VANEPGTPLGAVKMSLNLLHSFIRNDEGATAVEYCLIASGIVLVIIPLMGDINSGVLSMYGTIGGLFDYVL